MNLDWWKPTEEAWRARAAQGRVPHALMLLGPRGVGKRCAAAWVARSYLGIAGSDDGVTYPLRIPEHADLRWVTPAEDKQSIGIEQIRDLVAELGLTSYAGGGKVAVIEPANAMTSSAANSLLKTLEEPPGDTLLVLVVDRIGRLPATIFSRCQRIAVPLPAEDVSLAWLDRLQPGGNWGEALRLAGNAPLAAVAAGDTLDRVRAMRTELIDVALGKASPIEVAAGWSRQEPQTVLDWLAQTVQTAIRARVAAAADAREPGLPDSVLRRMDSRNLFCYLDTINGLRGQAAGSFNVQLTLESLLIDWAGGLTNCHRWYEPGNLPAITNTR